MNCNSLPNFHRHCVPMVGSAPGLTPRMDNGNGRLRRTSMMLMNPGVNEPVGHQVSSMVSIFQMNNRWPPLPSPPPHPIYRVRSDALEQPKQAMVVFPPEVVSSGALNWTSSSNPGVDFHPPKTTPNNTTFTNKYFNQEGLTKLSDGNKSLPTPPPPLSSSHSLRNSKAMELPKSYKPTSKDILCGRHKHAFNWPGNRKFRAIIARFLPQYNHAPTRLDRSILIIDIVETVCQTGGNFLKRTGKSWVIISDKEKRNKVGHALRDAAKAAAANEERALLRRRLQQQQQQQSNDSTIASSNASTASSSCSNKTSSQGGSTVEEEDEASLFDGFDHDGGQDDDDVLAPLPADMPNHFTPCLDLFEEFPFEEA